MNMRPAKRILALLAIIGIAGIIFWRWGHHESNRSHEPSNIALPEQPAVATKPDTSEWARRVAARKGANDLESVTRTFKEANDCLLYHGILHELNAVLNDERLGDLSHESGETLKSLDATSSRQLEIARRTEALCTGSNQEAAARVYADALLKAALLGSPDAESCFVVAGYHAPTEEGRKSAAVQRFFKERYIKHASSFMQNALERGDPYVASEALYRYIASPSGHPSAQDSLPEPDIYLTWRAARLASLRSTPEQRTRLESYLSMLEEQDLLPKADIQRADAWANAIYQRDFSGQPNVNPQSWVPCYSSPDLAP